MPDPDPFYDRRFTKERAIERSLQDGTLSQDDLLLLQEFLGERRSTKHISDRRAEKLVTHLLGWQRTVKKPFRVQTVADLYEGIERTKTEKVWKPASHTQGTNIRQLSTNTISDRIKAVKMFFLWMIENNYSSIAEKKVMKISPPPVMVETVSPDDILSYGEIEALVQGAVSLRDRAFLCMLYESGARIGEIHRLIWKDITFDTYGVKVNIDDRKEKKKRFARLTTTSDYLCKWKATYHPGAPGDDAPVFCMKDGRPFTYRRMNKILRLAKERADITRPVNLHLFRHSRVVHMIREGYQESVIKKLLWGNVNSKMFAVYANLATKDIDEEVLNRQGILTDDQKERNPLKPKQCPRCHSVNEPKAKFCGQCSYAFDVKAAMQIDDMLRDLLSHPEILAEWQSRRAEVQK